MGVKNLWDILESCKKTLPLHHLQNKRVCIDLSCWMVQLQNVNKTHCSMRDKLYLRGLFHRLRALIALNCSLIFVTDGSIPAIKISTYRRRLKLGSEVTQDETNSQKVTSLRRNMGSEFSCMIKEVKVLGMALGIPCLDGIEEGEAQCALLNAESLCDGCFSSDSDIFLFGARTVYRDICLGEGGYVVCYEMADIERKLGFGRNSLRGGLCENGPNFRIRCQKLFEFHLSTHRSSLREDYKVLNHNAWYYVGQIVQMAFRITLAILLGSDYSQGVHGLGPESACQIVKSVGDNAVLQKLASEGLPFAKKSKGSKKQGKASRCNNKENYSDNQMKNNTILHNSERDNQLLQVIDAYLKPKCHSADSDAVNRVLALHLFQRSKVQQICAQFFEWPPEKTDEYILPKIAERDLRRFANLCATSSELGLRLPLDKMPIKCPISRIVKQRKLQGRDCFEVSWEQIDGLETSIVPADLIESACPEKILEFEERRAQAKKPKPRRKKAENTTALKDVDLKLQELLLDIEQGSVTRKASLSTGSIPEKDYGVATVDLMNRELLLGTAQECSIERNACVSYYPASSSVAETEVIDLLSPSPLKLSRNTTKCEKPPNVQCVGVIDLSDSETETSPEHARKARELRLFLAGIRKTSLD